MEKIAVISDIHGNIPALETVLKDIKKKGIRRIFCLGDLAGKGPNGEKAIDICREVCQAITIGNWDWALAYPDPDEPPFLDLDWHRKRLGKKRLEYLKNLPRTIEFCLSGRKVRLYHASHIGVFHRVQSNAPDEALDEMFTNTEFTGNGFQPDTIGYGDIHHPFYRSHEGRVIFNAGSVGNPLDEPSAAYVILEGNYGEEKKGLFATRIIRLPYDIEMAVQQARQENMPSLEPWEIELRTALYRKLHERKKKET